LSPLHRSHGRSLTAPASTGTSGYTLLIADDPDQVAAAQRLRHDVFAGELGARSTSAVDGGRRRVR
jgi:putative hemolysin